jgi:hypothetical protein
VPPVQNSIRGSPARVLHWRAECWVVHPHLRGAFARLKAKIANDKITLVRRWPVGRIVCRILRSGLPQTDRHRQCRNQPQAF